MKKTMEVVKKYKYFDLESMEQKSEDVKVDFTKAETYADAVARTGNDESKLLAFVNAGLQRETFKAASASIRAKGASKATVFKFAAPWRLAPPFSAIEDRGAQTKAILEFFKSNAAFVEAIKAASAAASEEDENDEDGE